MKKKTTFSQGSQKGQALILILLVMAVTLTVVLSAVSRSVTEVSVTSYEENALRAFSAAEAGVEEKLLNPVIGTIPVTYPDPTDTSVSYSGEVSNPYEADDRFLYPKRLVAGETATFWLVDRDSSGRLSCKSGENCFQGSTLNICWGDPSYSYSNNNLRPAVEISVFYDDTHLSTITDTNPSNNFENLKVRRYANDSYARGNGIPIGSPPGACNPIDGQNFTRRTDVSLGGGDSPGCDTPAGCGVCNTNFGCVVMVIVRVLYSNVSYPQPVAIRAVGGAPSRLAGQGIIISSTGVAGESTRKVNVFQGHPEPPGLFDLAVFSGSSMTK